MAPVVEGSGILRVEPERLGAGGDGLLGLVQEPVDEPQVIVLAIQNFL
jgi:hypothetical protein